MGLFRLPVKLYFNLLFFSYRVCHFTCMLLILYILSILYVKLCCFQVNILRIRKLILILPLLYFIRLDEYYSHWSSVILILCVYNLCSYILDSVKFSMWYLIVILSIISLFIALQFKNIIWLIIIFNVLSVFVFIQMMNCCSNS